MGNYTFQHDIGEWVKGKELIYPVALTTASGAINGTDIDRTFPTANTNLFLSGKVIVSGRATLKLAKTAVYSWKMQHGDTTTAYTDYADKDAVTTHTLTLGTTTSTATQTNKHDISVADYDFGSAKGHLRLVVTPVIGVGSSTVTATGTVSAVLVYGGSDKLPPD